MLGERAPVGAGRENEGSVRPINTSGSARRVAPVQTLGWESGGVVAGLQLAAFNMHHA